MESAFGDGLMGVRFCACVRQRHDWEWERWEESRWTAGRQTRGGEGCTVWGPSRVTLLPMETTTLPLSPVVSCASAYWRTSMAWVGAWTCWEGEAAGRERQPGSAPWIKKTTARRIPLFDCAPVQLISGRVSTRGDDAAHYHRSDI